MSAWDEHIPFGMNLIDLVRPETLVELGTHAGDSYCAFCQAVAELSCGTRCYAVDTWRGDVHAGEYGDEVLVDLRAHHEPLYGGFSRLVQSTFAEALHYFDDHSVDLLHIDGLHTYEAVKQDFESWLPKLSRHGVVLMHDTNVREREFGVWNLWRELSDRFPHFEFVHGHGLGVLASDEPPEPLRPLFDASPQDAATVRTFFAEMGRRLAQEKELKASSAEREQLRRDVAHRERDIADLRAAVAAADSRDEARLAALESAQSELAALRAAMQKVESSRVWRAAQEFRQARDRLAPEGSLGRRLFDRVIGRGS